MGPFGGRALSAGDELPVGSGVMPARCGKARDVRSGLPNGGARVRVLTGPHRRSFDEK